MPCYKDRRQYLSASQVGKRHLDLEIVVVAVRAEQSSDQQGQQNRNPGQRYENGYFFPPTDAPWRKILPVERDCAAKSE